MPIDQIKEKESNKVNSFMFIHKKCEKHIPFDFTLKIGATEPL